MAEGPTQDADGITTGRIRRAVPVARLAAAGLPVRR